MRKQRQNKIFILVLCCAAGCASVNSDKFNASSFAPLPAGLEECLAMKLGFEGIYHIGKLSFKSTEETEWLLLSGTFLRTGQDVYGQRNHISRSNWFVEKPHYLSDWKDARVYIIQSKPNIGYDAPLGEDVFKMSDFEIRSHLAEIAVKAYPAPQSPATNSLGLVEAFVAGDKSYDEFVVKARAVYDKYAEFTDGRIPGIRILNCQDVNAKDWYVPVADDYANDLLEYISPIWKVYGIFFYRNSDDVGHLGIYIQDGRFLINVYPTTTDYSMEPEMVVKNEYGEVWTWGYAASIQEIILQSPEQKTHSSEEINTTGGSNDGNQEKSNL